MGWDGMVFVALWYVVFGMGLPKMSGTGIIRGFGLLFICWVDTLWSCGRSCPADSHIVHIFLFESVLAVF